jgi:hypothetical protein
LLRHLILRYLVPVRGVPSLFFNCRYEVKKNIIRSIHFPPFIEKNSEVDSNR